MSNIKQMTPAEASPMNNNALTITELADELGVAAHRVRYRLRQIGTQPVRHIGTTDLYPSSAAEFVRRALKQRIACYPVGYQPNIIS